MLHSWVENGFEFYSPTLCPLIQSAQLEHGGRPAGEITSEGSQQGRWNWLEAIVMEVIRGFYNRRETIQDIQMQCRCSFIPKSSSLHYLLFIKYKYSLIGIALKCSELII